LKLSSKRKNENPTAAYIAAAPAVIIIIIIIIINAKWRDCKNSRIVHCGKC